MYLLVISFVMGVCSLHLCASLPDSSNYLLLFPAVLLWRWRLFRPLALFACGFFWAAWQAHAVMQVILERELEGRTVYIEGEVRTLPERVSSRQKRFLFAIERLDAGAGKGWHEFGTTARLSWYNDSPQLQPGERWRLAVRLKQAHGFSNPGGFDYEGWLFQQRIRVTGYVRNDAVNTRLEAGSVSGITALRIRLLQAFDTMQSRPSMALVRALTVGERSAVSAQQWSVLNATGTTHLMAISGLHISLVAGLVFTLARLLWTRHARLSGLLAAPRAAALYATVAACCYASLSGFGIPARRALVMVTVFMLALVSDRKVQAPEAITVAMLATLLVDPLSVLAIGWWLSFWAVCVITWMTYGRCGYAGRAQRLVWMHVVLALAMLPLLLAFFQQASLIAPLANMLAVPLVSLLVIPLALLGVVLFLLVEPLGVRLLEAAGMLLDLLWPALQWLGELQHATWSHGQPPLWILLPVLAGMTILLLPRGIPGRSAGLVLMLPLFMVRTDPPDQGEFLLTLLDVGQGLAAVVQTASHVLVYDAGPRFSDTFDTGHAVVVPFLHYLGIRQLDRLVISHGDNDHIGGAGSLLQAVPAARILTSVPERFPDRQATSCREGDGWEWDGVRFDVLHPPERFSGSGNNGSCVLRIEAAGGGRVLLTGDIEEPAERRLLSMRRALLPAAVLVVPHHGSNTSSTPDFIAAIAPSHALFPAGYLNRYRLPQAEVLARYREAGVQTLETGRQGALTVRFSAHDGRPEIDAWRVRHPRYWHWRE